MSRVLVIPDAHMKKEVIEHGLTLARKYMADKVIMLGDYFDDWGASVYDYRDMIKYLKHILRTNPTLIPLLGNHELSYLGFPCSGFCREAEKDVYDALYNDHRFLFGIAVDGVLYSHAGVLLSWLKHNNLITQNELRYKLGKKNGAEVLEKCIEKVPYLEIFAQVGPARGGRKFPSPLWADLTEIVADAAPVKQVVGHTPLSRIENIGKVWFVDVYSNGNIDNEYLFVKDGEPEIVYYSEEDEVKYGRR